MFETYYVNELLSAYYPLKYLKIVKALLKSKEILQFFIDSQSRNQNFLHFVNDIINVGGREVQNYRKLDNIIFAQPQAGENKKLVKLAYFDFFGSWIY